MWRKAFILIFLLGLSGASVKAGADKGNKDSKGTCVLSGKILDESNAEALPGATVTIAELGVTTFADLDGFFSFSNLPEGDYTLNIEYVSYLNKSSDHVQVASDGKPKKFYLRPL